jgi:hypothetical protein
LFGRITPCRALQRKRLKGLAGSAVDLPQGRNLWRSVFASLVGSPRASQRRPAVTWSNSENNVLRQNDV